MSVLFFMHCLFDHDKLEFFCQYVVTENQWYVFNVTNREAFINWSAFGVGFIFMN